jgi:hypothetical protein
MRMGLGPLHLDCAASAIRCAREQEDTDMTIRKSLTVSLVLGTIVMAPALAQAATFAISRVQTENLMQMAKMHHQMHHRHHVRGHHHMMGKGPGRCGENMYFKQGHCMDARDKT